MEKNYPWRWCPQFLIKYEYVSVFKFLNTLRDLFTITIPFFGYKIRKNTHEDGVHDFNRNAFIL